MELNAIPALEAALAASTGAAGTATRIVARAGPVPQGDPLELFATAEALGLPRYAALCPAGGSVRVAIGAADAVVAADTGATLADALRAWTPRLDADGTGDALALVGGVAFEPRPAQTRDRAWRRFGSGRLTLPAIALLRDATGMRRVDAVRVDAATSPAAAARAHAALLARVSVQACPGAPPALRAPDARGLGERYARVAREVIDAIRGGAARKVVIADVETLEIDGQLPARGLLERLALRHPGCLSFAIGIGDTTFVGATPERMVSLCGGRVRADALAGTASRDSDDLERSDKEQAEHAFVVEAIAEALRARCRDVEVPARPQRLETGDVAHLHTPITATAVPGTRVLDLVEALHPTPAVAGTPRPAALELIRKHEAFDRGWYAGAVGHVDLRGEGEFHVALRCGLLRPGELRLYAGAGLVAASDPVREAAETRLKLGALRQAVEGACAG